MRALFRLRALVNRLLREGQIDPETKIRIEFSRQLNDANKRKAIEQYQREREKENQRFAEEIRELYAKETGRDIEPTETDILKYRLWKDQKETCPYTGLTIRISDFMGDTTTFDIEHTVPRSRGGEDAQVNKTLCQDYFNRHIKLDKLPSELANHAEVLARIESFGWFQKIADLEKAIQGQIRKSKSATTKAEKDTAIQRRHYLKLQLDDWRSKCERFTMTEVPQGFTNRQGVDIGIIGRYARLYLKSLFPHIYTVKGSATAAFRKMWGIQDEYSKKERSNHVHHCIDAITIACIGPREYAEWAWYEAQKEAFEFGKAQRPTVPKPWPTFAEDVKAVSDELLVAHHTPNPMGKQSRKVLRVRGKVKVNKQGEKIYVQGDTARGSLHQDTFYGAISRDDKIQYVVRKPLDPQKFNMKDVENIVDEAVKARVKEAIEQYGFKEAMDTTKHTIWMNRDKGIPIRKVRIFTPGVTNPIHLKPQRDRSTKTYKQDYHVANDSNYCMAIYEGKNAKGQLKRTFEIISNLEAARYFKRSTDKTSRPDLVPQRDANGYPLRWLLKTGTMVLFYEQSPAELYDCSPRELSKRLYKVTGLSTLTIQKKYLYGSVMLRHHQEARASTELTAKSGVWTSQEAYRPIISILHTQLNAYVEGYDFEMSVTGKITFKH